MSDSRSAGASAKQSADPLHSLPVPEATPAGLDPLEVRVDLRGIDAPLAARLRQLCYRRKLLVFKDQDLTDEQYIAFAREIGKPEPYFQEHYHHPEHAEIFVSSNVPLHGQKLGVAGTGRMWHSDYSFFDRPLSFTCVYPRILPEVRRETYYIDMARVYRALPDQLKAALTDDETGRPLTAFNDAWDYYKVQPWDIDKAVRELIDAWHIEAPGASHPLVITHPVTGEQILFCSSGFTKRVEGITQERGQDLLAQLFAFSEQPEHRHCQTWHEGDLLMWDNRSLIHHASTVPKGQKSRSYRISIYDELPFRAP
jgi:taurine dioxygenase